MSRALEDRGRALAASVEQVCLALTVERFFFLVKWATGRIARLAKHRWIIERGYAELKQELRYWIMKVAAGEDSITTLPSALPLTASS